MIVFYLLYKHVQVRVCVCTWSPFFACVRVGLSLCERFSTVHSFLQMFLCMRLRMTFFCPLVLGKLSSFLPNLQKANAELLEVRRLLYVCACMHVDVCVCVCVCVRILYLMVSLEMFNSWFAGLQRIKDDEQAKAVNIEHVEGSRHIQMVRSPSSGPLYLDVYVLYTHKIHFSCMYKHI